MSFCSINIFLHSQFTKQNSNESPIHCRNSQKYINKQTQKKKNIEKM